MNKILNTPLLRKLVHLLILRPLIKLIFGVNAIGRENYEFDDSCIIIANHNSHLDILLLFSLIPAKRISLTHPVAEKVYFSKSKIVFNLVDFLFQPIWIERGRPAIDGDPFFDLKAQLNKGHSVIIFPEGTRGEPGKMQKFKSGIGRLVSQYPQIPIIPVFLSGPEKVLPKTSYFLLPFWNHIIIGPPQVCSGIHRDITRLLEGILVGLSNSESAKRHKRKIRRQKSPRSIAVLGIDGSGKSTISEVLTKELSDNSSVCLISDRLDFYENAELKAIQPLGTDKLREIISSYAKKAKSLKMYKIPKITELLLRNHLFFEVRKWYNPDLIVMDGSPLLNMTGWAVLYKEGILDENICEKIIMILTCCDSEIDSSDPIFKQFKESAYFRRLKLNNLILPEIVILIDVDPAIACKRITTRGEQKQVHETEEKLGRLREAYKLVCQVIRDRWNIPVAIIDGSKDLESVSTESIKFASELISSKENENESAH